MFLSISYAWYGTSNNIYTTFYKKTGETVRKIDELYIDKLHKIIVVCP